MLKVDTPLPPGVQGQGDAKEGSPLTPHVTILMIMNAVIGK